MSWVAGLRCPLSYELLAEGQHYSPKGLSRLSKKLTALQDLPLTAEDQRQEALRRASKLSIQGVQFKLSAILNIPKQIFQICDLGGTYILKPPSVLYRELPENEDLTMRLAALAGIEVPLHGLVFGQDKSLTYFIKRFDRTTGHQKYSLEDFAQLSGLSRDTKYHFSMEKLIYLIEKYCSFPILEKKQLFLRVLFNYLVGNEDMHLKNFSLISRDDKVELAPAYDFLNTSLVMGNDPEEIALPLNGKKRNLSKRDLVDYYGGLRLGLNKKVIDESVAIFNTLQPAWQELIQISFLSQNFKNKYSSLVEQRFQVLSLN